jgi:hypothetical protein
MKNTYLKLTQAGTDRLMIILDKIQPKERDTIWVQLHNDVKTIKDIWSNIDRRSEHLAIAKKRSTIMARLKKSKIN